ncbi:hypothetical protein COX47_01600 [Candidatus Roizmanbacteria bacterium CG23_combo_of_CG06-09_8_20_14_all_35_49]|uniref:Inosine-guanosine phosphorylase n=1 Tax=Candidatus Roizmanbacteria bacterium CG23_combo_of_CG06-09_8_20_14_all_35_49 TaxID=1974863 RepID=A0A2G9Y794_9BACT|nr:MAG: hypothetical protein COX47_01600 [Candidatus Roizmanbacteria bacterium CG23_combo_of_CG06-09_8_20_14_all_35_49]
MAEKVKREKIIVPEQRSEGYQRWIKTGADFLRKELPFEGPADVSITIGSGLSSVVDHLQLTNRKVISYEVIGLPVGKVEGHKKEIIAGITPEDKKVIIINGRTHAYEIPEAGLETETWSHLERMELATGYLAMLNEIGVENMILTCAAGGINHPMNEDQLKPFDQESLPVIGLIASDVNKAYSSVHMGNFKAHKGNFFGLRDADGDLMSLIRQSMNTIEEGIDIPFVHYSTSQTTPCFEDVGAIYETAINGGQVLGMSYSYEKEFISGLDHIGRFAGIAVVTNSVELVDKDKPANASNIISVQELRRRYPWEFKIAHPASHQEVQDMGKLANERLGKALVQMVKSL